mmetsp:Transcript_24169/g.52223  ORF Transcript_24169/g.52223 Transcript_24169/m.52223 type:complete len:770 (-) Transcript_24169:483-2792(-)
MRISNGSSGNNIGRRRGTPRRKTGTGNMILNQKSILILVALCATIFSMGLIVGTRIFGTPEDANKNDNSKNNNNNNSNGGAGTGASAAQHASPLVAATSKVAPSDIQNLILESARAEKFERELENLEEAARKRGDKKLAAHLRGGLAPGDVNYNPHHAVDDVVEADGVGGGGGGDGAMYAGDNGDHNVDNVQHNEGQGDSMHNHFVDALKREMKRDMDKLAKGEKKIIDGFHKAEDKAKDAAMRLRGVGGSRGTGSAATSSLPMYPYMTSPISANYDFSHYEPLGGSRFTEYKEGDSPYDLTSTSILHQSDELARSRRYHVLGAMKHVWKNYKEFAFGRDELHPISKSATSNWGGMGTTLVDSLDTLWLMGMKDEFWEGRDWVRDNLSHDHVGQVSGFETTIRSLGGLLAAYDFSKDKTFLDKADDLGSRLIKAYDTPSGLPHGSINLRSGVSSNFGWNSNAYILAEIGTQQVEYRYLARATGKELYEKKSDHVFEILHDMQPADGLFPQNIRDGYGSPSFSGSKISFGAMGDSTYEYMLKVWVQGGKKEDMYREMWDKAMMGVHDQLVQKTTPNGLTFLADRDNGRIIRKMDHLACFMGGALALGAYTDPRGLESDRAQRDLKTAKALTYTCYQMYARTKTGIAPEFMEFPSGNGDDMQVPGSAHFYILRPETVEAFYYLNKLTGDPIYREWGWEVFQSIEKYCKTKYGYGSLKDVNNPGFVEDRMESFFMAETLKYLYLLFDPDSEIDPLNKHVFNTEAHPVRIFEN